MRYGLTVSEAGIVGKGEWGESGLMANRERMAAMDGEDGRG